MKIYTKTGDKGTTSLLDGQRVAKNHIRIEAYGTVDELNSYLGLIRDLAKDDSFNHALEHIQNQLFNIGSELALPAGNTKIKIEQLNETEVEKLEAHIDKLNQQLETLRNFIIPGGEVSASYCHIARTICRRAERKVVELGLGGEEVRNEIVQYLNRLSDLLFVLARFYTKVNKGNETVWISNG